ncbi:Ras GTPase activating protein [Purpureocillium lavendulum]|uniref:Ras GTPase activating protein n=1 Tax=Purpureocillium lavendulum TaxID=1247861 RepID=A0AB34FUD5_9HYPO|nr:Ras GTPase activating protein [Purpureocillium lavendulum]
MSQVKNLRAMFENKGDTSPDRGRSPAGVSISPSNPTGQNGAGSPRPLSKVRTNFVAIEKDGRIGLRRDPSGESSLSRRRLSVETDVESTVAISEKPTMASPDYLTKAPRKPLDNEPIPELPRTPADPSQASRNSSEALDAAGEQFKRDGTAVLLAVADPSAKPVCDDRSPGAEAAMLLKLNETARGSHDMSSIGPQKKAASPPRKNGSGPLSNAAIPSKASKATPVLEPASAQASPRAVPRTAEKSGPEPRIEPASQDASRTSKAGDTKEPASEPPTSRGSTQVLESRSGVEKDSTSRMASGKPPVDANLISSEGASIPSAAPAPSTPTANASQSPTQSATERRDLEATQETDLVDTVQGSDDATSVHSATNPERNATEAMSAMAAEQTSKVTQSPGPSLLIRGKVEETSTDEPLTVRTPNFVADPDEEGLPSILENAPNQVEAEPPVDGRENAQPAITPAKEEDIDDDVGEAPANTSDSESMKQPVEA